MAHRLRSRLKRLLEERGISGHSVVESRERLAQEEADLAAEIERYTAAAAKTVERARERMRLDAMNAWPEPLKPSVWPVDCPDV